MEDREPCVSRTDALPSPPFLGPHDPQHPTPSHTLTASCTGEAGIVVEVPHGLAGLTGPKHTFAAFHTGTCQVKNTAVSQEGTV